MDDRAIDRADLGSPNTAPAISDPVLETYFRQQLEQLYAAPSQVLEANHRTELGNRGDDTPEQLQGEHEEAYDFCLFTRQSASAGASNVLQRVDLRSPDPAGGQLDFTNRGRPDEYYLAGHPDAELAEEYMRAAVSSQDIIEGLRMRWRGMELPWRVTVVQTTETGKTVGVRLDHQLQAQTKKRKRSGKKRRIKIRNMVEAMAAGEVAAKKAQAEREAAERQKRTRRNREKKVKKRQKEKTKKVNDVQDPA